jgi:concanavalin A-like lectin/glucanase superfamily protein/thrombospondin type 3 repeat protein
MDICKRHRYIGARYILLCLILCLWCNSSYSQQLSFPSAEGFGRFSTGGRGGKVYNINSLSSASGSGGSCNAGGCSGGEITFHDCLRDRFGVGARTCIFRVGGTIDYGYSPTNAFSIPPYLTIAGQTAPGNGIILRGLELSFYGPDGGHGRNEHDVIIRHIRHRNRFYGSTSQCNIELVSAVYGAYNIIVDHYSAGWNWRSAFGAAYNAKGITYQRILLSEGLAGVYGCASPPGSEISLGALFSSAGSGTAGGMTGHQSGISYLHNYITHFDDRVPFNTDSSMVQAINNVVYNTRSGGWVQTSSSAGSPMEPLVEYINNYLFHGPQAQDTVQPRIVLGAGFTSQPPTGQRALDSQIYLSGNYHNVMRPLLTQPESDFVLPCYDYGQPGAGPVCLNITTTRYAAMPAVPSTVTALQAKQEVLDRKVGAYGRGANGVLLPQGMDTIDLRAIRAMQNGTGGTTSATSTAAACSDGECGETGTYANGTPYTDTDGDGISDSWETAHGLDPNNPADGPAIAGNGYSNLENFINELAGDTAATPSITNGLIAHYPFNDSAATATDATGLGHTGTLLGSPSYGTGAPSLGGGLVLNGTSQGVTIADANDLDLTSAYTLAAWVKPTATLSGFQAAMVKNYTYYLYASSGCAGTAPLGGHTNSHQVCDPTALTAGTWAHLAVTFDGSTVRFYRNGVAVGTPHVTAVLPGVTTGTLQLGTDQFGEWFGGTLDDVRVYARALSPEEVLLLKNYTDTSETPPTMSITTTSGSTAVSIIPITGTATDDVGVTSISVACAPSCGSPAVVCTPACGAAATTVAWSTNVSLQAGVNVVTVTVNDTAAHAVNQQVTITLLAPTFTNQSAPRGRMP